MKRSEEFENDEGDSLVALIGKLSTTAPKLSPKGSLSRLGSFRRLFMLTGSAHLNGSFVLVDHNENKLAAARKHWTECVFLNPYELRPTVRERFLLLIAVFAGKNRRLSLQSIALGLTVRNAVRDEQTTIIWNPTQVFHHGIVLTARRTECYLKSPIVPLPSGCRNFVGVKLIGQIYRLERSQFQEHAVEHRITSQTPRFAIYLSYLGSSNPREERLLQFAEFLVSRGQALKIFLHYRDRRLPLPQKVADFPPEVVSLEDSLFALSSEQLSISGVSTVGLEISSISKNHFFCIGGEPDVFGRDRTVTPLYKFLSSEDQVLRTTQTDAEWFSRLTAEKREYWGTS